MAIEENMPTPFGMFLEVDAKPARGCWHELLERFSLSLSYNSWLFIQNKISIFVFILSVNHS